MNGFARDKVQWKKCSYNEDSKSDTYQDMRISVIKDKTGTRVQMTSSF